MVNWYLRKKGDVLFNDAFNTFYLQLYGIGHMVMKRLDSERGNQLPPLHGLLFAPFSLNISYKHSIHPGYMPETENIYNLWEQFFNYS